MRLSRETALCLSTLLASCSSPSGTAPFVDSNASVAPAAGGGGQLASAAPTGQAAAGRAAQSGTAPAAPMTSGGPAMGPDQPAQPPAAPDASILEPEPDAATPPPAAVRCADVSSEPSPGPGSGYPGGRWKVPEATHASVVEQNVQVMMSDGVALVGDVSYPADLQSRMRAGDKFPVLLTQNPYGAGAFGAEYGEIFVTHGYIFASFDVRGTGRSAGTHDMFSPREAEDGAALVAWAAALEGSDGRVGLQGCSQLGINQLETATLLGANSPVKAMIPACASGDFYRDTAFDNGIPTIVGAALASPDAAEGGDMAYYREYWKTRDRLARAPAIAEADIPTLLWSGWHEPGSLGSLELYVALQNLHAGRPVTTPIGVGTEVSARYQVILGDWAHAGGLDLGIELQWFDTWIKGVDTGLATETTTPLHLAELGGTKRWINSRCYPLVEHYTPLYLAADGKLSKAADAMAGGDMLQWSASMSDALEYVSEPFADGALVAGPIAAQLHVSSTNSNMQLVVEVLDEAPDGQRKRLSQSSILGSLRRTDPARSWYDADSLPQRPHLTLDEEQPLTAGESTVLDVPLWPSVWSVEPQHSLVVRITTQPNSNDCLEPLGVPVGCYPSNPTLESLRGGSYQLQQGSLISLPLVEHGAFSTAASATSATGNTATPLPTDW
jgi:uncharacterized protein